MTAENTARQPKGIPAGGQFAAQAHAEPGLTLTAPEPVLPTQREILEARLHAARTQYEAFAQNEWAGRVQEAYPDARYAYAAVVRDRAGQFTAGMGLFRDNGDIIDVSAADTRAFSEALDPSWDVAQHYADPADGLFVEDSEVFGLTSIQDRWKEIQDRPVLEADPFAHLQGMGRARAEYDHGDTLQTKAVHSYVQNLRTAVLAEAPTAKRIVVDRSADVESGLTFRLSYVEDANGRHVDADLQGLQEYRFQDIHLDPHVEYDEVTDDLYINIDHGN